MSTLAEHYADQYKACTINPAHAKVTRIEAARVLSNKRIYDVAAGAFNGLPWWVVGILHSLECGLSFTQHLHNGDPLTARTVQVPKGRPKTGTPPFTWQESAMDALRYDGFDSLTDWRAGHALVAFENYNGTGYRRRGVPSPYLWSFTDQYRCGKYVADGCYDALAVSRQCGAAALMKALENLNVKL